MNLKLIQLSSLEKVFLNRSIASAEYNSASILRGEEFAYQIAYFFEGKTGPDTKADFDVTVSSPLAQNIAVYDVGNVPSEMPAYQEDCDDDYIITEPGLFPDVLNKLRNGQVTAVAANRALWINLKTDKGIKAGTYPITITFKNTDSEISESKTFSLEIIDAVLPEQTLIFTQWFHGDCIASYYKEEVFSESHWTHLENFIKTAANNGINMLLTPVFTPPLDTAIGGERPTIQLVDVYLKNGQYSFDFAKLKRWIDICKKSGIKYYEISHLFTQWGAKFTPKIIAEVDGVKKRIFGWDVSATSYEYKRFLGAFLPQLTEFLKAEGIAGCTYFHVSDEPTHKQLESYKAAADIVRPYLKGFKIVDALSDFDFYKLGVVEHPIPATNHIKPFLGIKNLWTYYCCGQAKAVSNRFFAMPSYRNRIIGLQLFKYDIKGFLQWGYNFYYSQCSKYPINPYLTTDAGFAFPSGDAFSVYPGDDGTAVESLRLKVFLHALQDMRALSLLETMMPREDIITILDSQGELEFDNYPKSAEFILSLRERVNALIKENI